MARVLRCLKRLSWLSFTRPASGLAPAVHPTTQQTVCFRESRDARSLGEELLMAATRGTVKRLIIDKGFGFVAAEDGSEYFFHRSACHGVSFDDLREGQPVTFDKTQGPKGPRAENVTPS